MPRTAITPITPKGPYPTLPVAANSLDVALATADVANGNAVDFTSSRMLIIAQNSHASDPQTFTVASSALNGRTGDVTNYSLAAGEVAALLVERAGWVQSDGKLYLNGANAAIKFAVIKL